LTSARDLENRFLGSLLGLAIGDALGMPIADLSREEARARYGEIRDYQPRNPGKDDEIPAGEITDETETVLCVVESMTVNNGQVDSENISARLMYLVDGPSRHWMPDEVRFGIERASEHDGMHPDDESGQATLAAAVRGVPVGLMHAVGGFDADNFLAEVRQVARLSHGSAAQEQLAIDVATEVINAVRDEPVGPFDLEGVTDDVASQRELIRSIADKVRDGKSFEDVVLAAVNGYLPADSTGAIAGAIAGAARGAADIPQHLIDGLEARVYLSLAAPWFYRTATRRAGTLIDLRQV
jgi:ADP-ribosylglycohydrolase